MTDPNPLRGISHIEMTHNSLGRPLTESELTTLTELTYKSFTSKPSLSEDPCTHIHTFHPRLYIPLDNAQILQSFSWKIPTLRQFLATEKREIKFRNLDMREMEVFEEPMDYETMWEAIERVNAWHGNTVWSLHWYRMDDGDEMATIARKTNFRDRDVCGDGWVVNKFIGREMTEYHMSLGDWERLVCRAAADSSTKEVDGLRRNTVKEMEDCRMHATVAHSAQWARGAEHSDVVPERWVRFQEEVLAKSDALIKIDEVFPDDWCILCRQKFDEECGEPTKCRACPCDEKFGRNCLRDWLFEKWTCPICEIEVD